MNESPTVALEQIEDYRFALRFTDVAGTPVLATDEPPPLGGGSGPNPVRLLLGAVGNCLCASLLFALHKFKDEPGPLHADATATLARNDAGRWRVGRIEVEIRLGVAAAALPHLARALSQFEDYCVVTQSVRAGIPVRVTVRDADGSVLHAAG